MASYYFELLLLFSPFQSKPRCSLFLYKCNSISWFLNVLCLCAKAFYTFYSQDIMSQLGELNSMWTDVQKDFIGKSIFFKFIS